ncbi:hypothetical protein EDB19DRAFT_1743766 [Suillus lakei]|nr:hypothetical protein EDB19DRAFT_1743766 [Suillus lakei]
MPAAGRNMTPVECPVCHKTISRKADLPRHMHTHDENKEALMYACPFHNCDYKALQKSNVQTHIRTHTRERSKTCPHPGCAFATTDPGSLTRHRKHLHNYQPKARRNFGGKAARTPEGEIPTSPDLNDLTFPNLAALIPCDALSSAEPSNSSIPQFSGEFPEFSWERLFPDLSADNFASVHDQPSQLPISTSNYFQPPTVPVDLSTLHMPQFDPELFSDVNYQQPVPELKFQSQPVSGNDLNDLNNSLPVDLDEFLQKYGSGYFEGRCGYQDSATYSMAQPSFTNEYNIY